MVSGDVPRWDRARPAVPYLFFLLPAGFALLREWRLELLVLAVLAMAWHWFMVGRQPGWGERPWALAGYFVVLLVLVGALVRIDGVFSVTGVGAFIQAFTVLPGRWAYAGVAATAAVLVVVPEGRSPAQMVFSFLVATLVAATAGLSIRAISQQNDQRKVMIEQLRRTGAELSALAAENADLQAQLLTRAREAGVLGERQRMAREIHDTVAQGLTGIITQLEAIDGAVDDPVLGSRLAAMRALAGDSLNEARRSMQALRPAPLEEAQLPTALAGVAATWSRATGTPAGFSVTGDPRPLHLAVESTLLRTAQEALANVAKHAGASRVGLTLSYMEDVVVLDVRDDGSGFVPEETGPSDVGGFGLVAMRQRVTRLAGDLVIEAGPGQGTAISASIPAIPADPSSTATG
ncbi:sensor histidine kinase [Nonomuraea sp. ZG12]|uniref:sensor histidine kinase n=1 Tax=Nonomuraea sp. ZG12 TaxID=3452207 RepID=UPI003F8A9073